MIVSFEGADVEWRLADWATYKNRLLLRSQQVANSPEIIRRLGVIAMNTPLEVDIVSTLPVCSSLLVDWS